MVTPTEGFIMTGFRNDLIKLAFDNPGPIRDKLLPILAKAKTSGLNGVSIGPLAKTVQELTRKLEGMGLQVETEVNRAGPSGREYGPSTVDLEITAEWTDEEGDEQEGFSSVSFIAGPWEDVGRRGQFPSTLGLREMKRRALDYILKDLKRADWKQP